VLDIRFNGQIVSMNMEGLTGRYATVYGQQEVVKDLVAARLAAGGAIHFEAEALGIDNVDGDKPVIRYREKGEDKTLECDFVAACVEFYCIGCGAFSNGKHVIYVIEYPLAWFGILSMSPPIKEMTYANHERGYALCRRRSTKVSRHYIQVPPNEDSHS